MSCFAHTLQLVVAKFSEVLSCSATVKKAHGLVKKVNKSTKATELLIQHCGKKLLKDCPTRWEFHIFAYQSTPGSMLSSFKGTMYTRMGRLANE